ncbi:helix-turn-helix domain-containing protein [Micromonospora phytophila]|uniref:helix-turn-helix domain-containing protein n=1 Tax=Micromonospora phytophila TaxID=709888 RepID=UPI00202E91D6|nr:helix-turn-helix domain-containing protein [Micromonospora phytophila]MCM0675244.1 helix-turn-helix domain-containing protein [Micromonospora phytophila]
MSTTARWSRVVRLVPRTGAVVVEPVTYTVREVANLLNLSLGSTYALVRDGTIPATRLGGRWLIPRARFHAWLDAVADPAAATGTDHGRGRRFRASWCPRYAGCAPVPVIRTRERWCSVTESVARCVGRTSAAGSGCRR